MNSQLEPTGNQDSIVHIRGGKQNHKLIASDTRQDVAMAECDLQNVGYRSQHLIPFQVAVCLVDSFKEVDINRQ